MDDEQSSAPGSRPEFGAIFMSNSATKKECLRRRLLGLPSSQSHFVKQVQSGMILFLFEFERRELHGVFQACSDGAMNIVPHAFSSSGMQFPAQVKFRPLWNCHPVCENEFCDAIRENYFSRNKFRFGLSEDQVRRLLSLFSVKRVKDQAPERQLTRCKVASPGGYVTGKNRRLVDKSPISNCVLGECDVNKHHGSLTATMHQGDSFYADDRATGGSRFGTFKDIGYEASAFLNDCFQDLRAKFGRNLDDGEHATNDKVDNEWNTGIKLQPAVPIELSSGNFRSISNDDRFADSDRIERKRCRDDGFHLMVPIANHTSQSEVNPQVYSSKHVLETDQFIDDPTRPSSRFLPSTEMQNSNVSYPLTSEDSIVTSTLPYDLGAHGSNYPRSLSLGFNNDHPSLQEYPTHDSFVGNVLVSSTNPSFPSLLESRRTTTANVSSDSMDFIPLPYSDQYEGSGRTSLPIDDHIDNLVAEYSNKEHFADVSLLKPSLSPVLSSEIRNFVGVNERSSSFGTYRSEVPSVVFSDRYPASLQDKHDYQVAGCENDTEFGDDGFMFKECHRHGDFLYNDNRATENDMFAIYRNEDTSLSPAAYHNSECLYPDYPKKRSSVFSRLSLPPKAFERDDNTSPGISDSNYANSVNDVMDMLQRSHHQWVKTSKQLVKHRDDAAFVRDRKQDTRKDDSAMIPNKINVKPTTFSNENSCQKNQEATFVDFKRRSASRKKLEDGKTRNHCAIPNNSASAPQCKKRKLIRPAFGVVESSDRGMSGDTSENLMAFSTECSVSKEAESIKVTVCHGNENDTLQNVELPNVICQTAVESNSVDMGIGPNSDKVESSVALKNADEDGKESSQSNGVSSMSSGHSGEAHVEIQQVLTTMI
ncbi:hypothetical protein like AT2G35140 [Hibiscus trionum]|uniref:DCD domain-containing protein n=1 Tax=Hibiscus trionum TaxID=183268 RepID=A0A9W7LQ94_HIBTR|nr:hypothetical protein like AT2G35140 [Hibiscus trionum]